MSESQTTLATKKVHFSKLSKEEQQRLLKVLEEELKIAIDKEIANGRPSHIKI